MYSTYLIQRMAHLIKKLLLPLHRRALRGVHAFVRARPSMRIFYADARIVAAALYPLCMETFSPTKERVTIPSAETSFHSPSAVCSNPGRYWFRRVVNVTGTKCNLKVEARKRRHDFRLRSTGNAKESSEYRFCRTWAGATRVVVIEWRKLMKKNRSREIETLWSMVPSVPSKGTSLRLMLYILVTRDKNVFCRD